MKIYELDKERLYYAFLAGATEVIQHKGNLNKINVFPVPDGDTGTNLATTMNWISQHAKLKASMKETVQSIADAALTGARGNSGTIFAQYVNGMCEVWQDEKELSIQGFSKAVKKGVSAAYDAIEKPVEGTMITVIRDWANAINQFKSSSDEYIDVLSKALQIAEKSLEATPEKLPILKKKGVVDSGAKGFVLFLKGFLQYLKTGKIQKDIMDEQEEELVFHHHEDLTCRYCTEAVIHGKNIDIPKLKLRLKEYGDSIVVGGNERKVKVHVHTNEPEQLFFHLKEYGALTNQKAEDMRMQQEIVTNRKGQIALVTDSIADIPKALIDHYQIHQVPLEINLGESTYLDRVTIHAQQFYKIIETEKIASSTQPSIKNIEALYSYLSTYYDAILVISVSKEMSGTYNVFQKAAVPFQQKGYEIRVINSKVNSGAQGLVVLKAAEAIEGGASYEDVLEVVEKAIEKARIYVSVNTLEGMVRQGRISQTVGKIGKWVNLKPIVSIDESGKGSLIGKSFSIKGNTKGIYDLVRQIKEQEGIDEYILVHGKGEERLEVFQQGIVDIIGKKPRYVEEISSIVAMSAGENTIAVALLKA